MSFLWSASAVQVHTLLALAYFLPWKGTFPNRVWEEERKKERERKKEERKEKEKEERKKERKKQAQVDLNPLHDRYPSFTLHYGYSHKHNNRWQTTRPLPKQAVLICFLSAIHTLFPKTHTSSKYHHHHQHHCYPSTYPEYLRANAHPQPSTGVPVLSAPCERNNGVILWCADSFR